MRLQCPFCGERDAIEFVYLGDAGFERPRGEPVDALSSFTDAVYLRDNPAGAHRELWYHQSGCRSWLCVTRNTLTHEIVAVEFASQARRAEGLS